ncbi:GCN5-like N-acetyltransferase [Jeotgalibacillus malaysiensis]|uniref:GCN5-like N-acetyltransferase n=1 Tax=Jeotgalibacillus malaysiensis TaxID=1508404 RepID=A0A0B5AVB8_9BACL|nr:GNAT family N-acetyltransferase [Jeotgalibacillus malaysiensis]AJD92543.1 GCN5-like N-acetyltransferase [Jeotgalibacillus malaysiensis]
MKTENIKECTSKEECLAAFPVMRQLRTHLDETAYLALIEEARQKDSYRLFALYENDEIVALAGFKPMITLYYGRFVWICDLVTDQAKRSNGYGEKLLEFVHDWASKEGYERIALSSGLQRIDAHRFYEEKMEYDKVSYVFKKEL